MGSPADNHAPPPSAGKAFVVPPPVLYAVAVFFAALAVTHAFGLSELTIDETVIDLLIVALVAIVLPNVKEFSFGSISFSMQEKIKEIETRLEDTRSAAKTLEEVHLKELDPIPPKAAALKAQAARVEAAFVAQGPDGASSSRMSPDGTPPTGTPPGGAEPDPEDPNRGQFGGRSKTSTRRLSAKVEATTDPNWFRVTLRVELLEPNDPLEQPVRFHLHPTFTTPSHWVEPVDGVATDRLYAYGAFTVGAEADGGKCRLELNLANLPDAPATFRAR